MSSSFWNEWIAIEEGIGRKPGKVKCRYCVSSQLRKKTKCAKHTDKCKARKRLITSTNMSEVGTVTPLDALSNLEVAVDETVPRKRTELTIEGTVPNQPRITKFFKHLPESSVREFKCLVTPAFITGNVPFMFAEN